MSFWYIGSSNRYNFSSAVLNLWLSFPLTITWLPSIRHDEIWIIWVTSPRSRKSIPYSNSVVSSSISSVDSSSVNSSVISSDDTSSEDSSANISSTDDSSGDSSTVVSIAVSVIVSLTSSPTVVSSCSEAVSIVDSVSNDVLSGCVLSGCVLSGCVLSGCMLSDCGLSVIAAEVSSCRLGSVCNSIFSCVWFSSWYMLMSVVLISSAAGIVFTPAKLPATEREPAIKSALILVFNCFLLIYSSHILKE